MSSFTTRRQLAVNGVMIEMWTISSPEAAIRLVCARNRDLWVRLKARQKDGQISLAVETCSFQPQSPTHAQNQTGTRISWFRSISFKEPALPLSALLLSFSDHWSRGTWTLGTRLGSGFGFDLCPCASRPLVKGSRALGTRLRCGRRVVFD